MSGIMYLYQIKQFTMIEKFMNSIDFPHERTHEI